MKDYSNPGRKPMMYGGMAKKKAMGGGMATSASGMQSPTMVAQKAQRQAQQPRTGMGGASTPRMTMSEGGSTDDTRRAQIKAQYEKGGKDREAVMAMANGKGRDAAIARSVIAEKGGRAGAASFPSGDKEPAGMMYGGKAKKKMAMGGKMPMVEKDGKKVPAFAADGKGKMMSGGMAKKGKK